MSLRDNSMALNKRLPGLDFLRAFAALWVFVFHFMEIVPEALKPSLVSFYVIVGWNGVDLFFVLSGFLIGSILCRSDENVKSFVIRRFFRIYPAYLLVVALCLFINKPYLLDNTMLLLSHLFLFNNLIQGYGGAINGVLWTLGAEFQFYIMAALILLLPKGRFLWPSLIGLTIVISLLYRSFVFDRIDIAERFFYATQLPGMLGLFGLGFLAVHLKRMFGDIIVRFFPIFLVLALASLFFYFGWLRSHILDYWENDDPMVWGRLYSGMAFSMLVLVFACVPEWLGNFFKKSGVVFVGEISYGIYLTHLFFMDLIGPYEIFFMQYHWSVYGLTLVFFTFASSCLIYFLVELPFIKLGARLAKAQTGKKPRFVSETA